VSIKPVLVPIAALVVIAAAGCTSSRSAFAGSIAEPSSAVVQQAPQSQPAQDQPAQDQPAQDQQAQPQGLPAGVVPQELVGTWCGGSDDEPHWTLTFNRDGTFSATNPASPSYGGTAVVSDEPDGTSVITEYTTNGPLPATSIRLGQNAVGMTELQIGGESYYPGACES
jgi:hypothetical protein